MSDSPPSNRKAGLSALGPRALSASAVEKVVASMLRRAVRSQSGAARSYVAKLREAHPEDSPAQIVKRLDSRFLTLVTASGGAVGAVGAVPGVGTLMAMGAVSAESIVFLEATAFYTLAVAAAHGMDVTNVEHEEALVMTILLGASGTAILSNAVGRQAGSAASGSLAGGALRMPSIADLNKKLMTRFAKRFAMRRATLALGKLAPAGVGAAIGGWGNRKIGSSVIKTAHTTFSTPPASWGSNPNNGERLPE